MRFSLLDNTHVRVPVFAGILLLALTAAAGAATFWVDNQSPGASLNGPGTEAQPYSTISGAVNAHKGPGVTILVRPGIYREQVSIQASGTSDAPFVIRATAPGVIVEGADAYQSEAQWTQPGAAPVAGNHQPQSIESGWLAAGVDWQPSQVFVGNRRLQGVASVNPAILPADAFTWVPGQGLYASAGGPNPGALGALVGRRQNGFRVSGKSWVTIDGFDIRHTEDAGVNIQIGCSDVVVSNNRISFCGTYGVRAVGSQRVRIESNVVSDGAYHGIGLTAGSTGCVVRRNDSFRNADPVNRRAVGIYLFASPNNIIEANRTFENQDTGIQFDAGSNDCLAFNNRSYLNGDHGYDHLDATNTSHVNDVAYGNIKDGFSIEGTSPNTQIYNSIAFDNGLNTGEYDLWVNAASSPGFQSDYNIFWNSTEQFPFRFGATRFTRLADYRAASGQDAHSIQANPLLGNPRGGDFVPMAGSPAIDAGTSAVANWPTTDEAGRPRFDVVTIPNKGGGPVTFCDIGSDEYTTVGPEGAGLTAATALDDRRASLLGVTGAPTLSLSSGFPNPARGAVEFSLDLPQAARVEWAVYDVQGRAIWSESRTLAAGRSQLRWDGSAASGEPSAVGLYLVRARVDGTQLTRRVVRF